MSHVFSSVLLSSSFMKHSTLMTISYNKDVGLWVRDSLKCPSLIPLWNGLTKIYWFRWMTLMVNSLKQTRYSLSDYEGPCQMLNRLMVDIFMLLPTTNWCTSFFTNSWKMVMEARGRSMYYHKATSLKCYTTTCTSRIQALWWFPLVYWLRRHAHKDHYAH